MATERATPEDWADKDRRPFAPRGQALELLRYKGKEVLISGGFGTGKSRVCLEKMHICATKYPGMRGLIFRKTRESLSQTALVTWESQVIPPHHPILEGPQKENRTSYKYPNGSEVVLCGLDKPGKALSSEYDLAFCQEAIEVTQETWEAVSGRMRNGGMPYQQLMGDTNPGAPTHWLKKRCDQGITHILYSTHKDNPILWDGKDWTTRGKDYLERLGQMTGVRRLRYLEGKWVQAEGVVYEGWRAGLHLIDRFPVPPEVDRFLSVDFGFTNPTVVQWWFADSDGRLYRYREIYKTKTLIEDHAKVIEHYFREDQKKPFVILCDHDAEDRATLERHLGLPTTAAKKNVPEGIQTVAEYLRPAGDGRPRLFLMRDSLVERDRSLENAGKPCCTEEEFDSYCFVAGTMIQASGGEKPIEDVSVGDFVWTTDGLREVTVSGPTRHKEIVKTIQLSNGRTLTGTGNHPVFVLGKGWVSIDSLSCNDKMESWNPFKSNLTELPTAVTQTVSTGQTGITTSRIGHRESWVIVDCMWTYGGPFTATFRKTITFIIRMAIHLIMLSKILSASLRRNMLPRTGGILSASHPHGSPNWTRPESWPHWLCRQRSFGRVPVNVARSNGLGKNLPNGSVFSAANTFKVGTLEKASSVPERAILPGENKTKSITRNECVPSAGERIESVNGVNPSAVPVHVLSITEEKKLRTVYNLTVKGKPEYYANGILVHNCWRPESKKGDEPVKQDDHGLDALRYLVAYARRSSAWTPDTPQCTESYFGQIPRGVWAENLGDEDEEEDGDR